MAKRDPATYAWSTPVLVVLFVVITLAQGMCVPPLPLSFLPLLTALTSSTLCAQDGRLHGPEVALQGGRDRDLHQALALPAVARRRAAEPQDVPDQAGQAARRRLLGVLAQAECVSLSLLSRPPLPPSLARARTQKRERADYISDWTQGLIWGLSAGSGTDSYIPYFYPVFHGIMLLHRNTRDDAKCARKYGKDWEEYKKLVPYS